MIAGTTPKQIEKQNLQANAMSEKVQEVEKLLVIQPAGTFDDQLVMVNYVREHGNLEKFPIEIIKHIFEKATDAKSLLRDTFNKILFFETATYLGHVAAVELKNDGLKKEFVTKFLKLGFDLLHAKNYEPYDKLVEAYAALKAQDVYSGEEFVASNRAGTKYLQGIDSLLEESKPGYEFKDGCKSMNFSFEGRQQVVYLILSGSYKTQNVPEIAKKWPHFFVPVIGYIRLRVKTDDNAEGNERVNYAETLLNEFARTQRDGVVIPPSEISISGFEPLNYVRQVTDHIPL